MQMYSLIIILIYADSGHDITLKWIKAGRLKESLEITKLTIEKRPNDSTEMITYISSDYLSKQSETRL
jgi:hypothetical protein